MNANSSPLRGMPRPDLALIAREAITALCTVHTYSGEIFIPASDVAAAQSNREIFAMESKLVAEKSIELITTNGMGEITVRSWRDTGTGGIRTDVRLTILRLKLIALPRTDDNQR